MSPHICHYNRVPRGSGKPGKIKFSGKVIESHVTIPCIRHHLSSIIVLVAASVLKSWSCMLAQNYHRNRGLYPTSQHSWDASKACHCFMTATRLGNHDWKIPWDCMHDWPPVRRSFMTATELGSHIAKSHEIVRMTSLLYREASGQQPIRLDSHDGEILWRNPMEYWPSASCCKRNIVPLLKHFDWFFFYHIDRSY